MYSLTFQGISDCYIGHGNSPLHSVKRFKLHLPILKLFVLSPRITTSRHSQER